MLLRRPALLLALSLAAHAGACVIQADPQAEQDLLMRVPGRYVAHVDGQRVEMILESDGSGSVNGQPGRWEIQLGTLMLSDGNQWAPASLEGGTLSVQMPDGVVVFQREDAAAAPGAEVAAEGPPADPAVAPVAPAADENVELRGRLIGCWEDYSHSGGNTGSSSYQSTLRLGADGGYARRVYSSAFVGDSSVVNDTTETGRFQVVGDSLRLMSDQGGTADYATRIDGGILYLNGAKHLPCS
jgi:hypothetical protein